MTHRELQVCVCGQGWGVAALAHWCRCPALKHSWLKAGWRGSSPYSCPSPVQCQPSHVKAEQEFAHPTSHVWQHPGVDKKQTNWEGFSPGYPFPASSKQGFTSLVGKWLDSQIIILGTFLLVKHIAASPVCSSPLVSSHPLLALPRRILQVQILPTDCNWCGPCWRTTVSGTGN